MISIPLSLTTGTARTAIFPRAVSRAFAYSYRYYNADTLKVGQGYWLKFPASQSVGLEGVAITRDTISVVTGWNMIGSIATPVAVGNITQIPSGITKGTYFSYNRGYAIADSIRPSQGYWIKASANGQLVLSSSLTSGQTAKLHAQQQPGESLNSLTISDNDFNQQSLYFGRIDDSTFSSSSFELPPQPPPGIFDARFESQHYVEKVDCQNSATATFVVLVRSQNYPVTLRWNVIQPEIQSIVLTDGQGGKLLGVRTLGPKGTLRVENPKVDKLVIAVKTLGVVPTEFALRQNYPNPFNPSTTIRFDVPTQAVISLTVYNIIGQAVAVPVRDKQYQPGSYSVMWSAQDHGSGVYFYQLVAKDISGRSSLFRMVKKLVFVK